MAAPTWSNVDSLGLEVQGVVASGGTANDAPTANEGIACGSLSAVEVGIEADASQTVNKAGALECWSKIGGSWFRFPEMDISVVTNGVAGVRRVAFLGPSAGKGIPVIAKAGRLVWVPNGLTVSSGGVTVRIAGVMASKVT